MAEGISELIRFNMVLIFFSLQQFKRNFPAISPKRDGVKR
jgi:hypothetical protein